MAGNKMSLRNSSSPFNSFFCFGSSDGLIFLNVVLEWWVLLLLHPYWTSKERKRETTVVPVFPFIWSRREKWKNSSISLVKSKKTKNPEASLFHLSISKLVKTRERNLNFSPCYWWSCVCVWGGKLAMKGTNQGLGERMITTVVNWSGHICLQ